MECIFIHGVFMNFYVVIFSLAIIVLTSGCASARNPVGKSDIPDAYDGRWDGVYGQLSPSGFTEYCVKSSNDEYVRGYSCDHITRNLNYFSLGNGQPAFDTGGMTCSSRVDNDISNGLRIKSSWGGSKCLSPSFVWKKDPVLSTYLTYVFVLPLLNWVKEYEFYFDWNKASKALENAVSGDKYDAVDKAVSDLKAEYLVRLENKKKVDAEYAERRADEAKRKAELERQEEKERQLELRRRAEESRLLPQRFHELSMRPKKVGDKVCRRDNLYGFVENVSGSRIQVRVIGQVYEQEVSILKPSFGGPNLKSTGEQKNAKEYYFFREGQGTINSRTINDIGWFEASDFAECSFQINY
jgi:hypothetical protein